MTIDAILGALRMLRQQTKNRKNGENESRYVGSWLSPNATAGSAANFLHDPDEVENFAFR
jgi:hypothetical protein